MKSTKDTNTKLTPRFTLTAILLAFGVLAVLVGFISGYATTEPPKIKVGAGETVVTAPICTPMSGYRRTDVSKDVHDDLYARTLVIEGADGTSVVLMTVAVINMGVGIVDTIRDGINKQTGIPD